MTRSLKTFSVLRIQYSTDADKAFEESAYLWSVYAQLPDRHNALIPWRFGIRERDGVLQANIGEYRYFPNYTTGEYISDEWVTPSLIFAMHKCEGCHYPPDMCCLQDYKEDSPHWYDDSFLLAQSLPMVELEIPD